MLFFKCMLFFEIKSVSEVSCFELNEAVLFQKPTGAFQSVNTNSVVHTQLLDIRSRCLYHR